MGNGNTFYFFISVDGIIVKEALIVLTNLSQLMAVKIEEPISHICVWVKGRIPIAVARSHSRIICGASLPSPLRER